MVMEIMRGGTLGRPPEVGQVRSRTSSAVRMARRRPPRRSTPPTTPGVVHRDIKPGNLLLDGRERLAVADFGIARLAWEDQLTATGQVLGTAAYLSPEQAMGEAATAASDRYALAVVAYELLTGTRPFEAEHFAAQARAHVEDPVPPASSRAVVDLSKAVDAVLERGLAKDPDDRWGSSEEFVAALERTLSQPSTTPTRKLGRREKPVAAAPPRAAVLGPRDAPRARRARQRPPAYATRAAPGGARRRPRRGRPDAPARRAARRTPAAEAALGGAASAGAGAAGHRRGRRRDRARELQRRRRSLPAGGEHARGDGVARAHGGADGGADRGAHGGADRGADASPTEAPTEEPTPEATPTPSDGRAERRARPQTRPLAPARGLQRAPRRRLPDRAGALRGGARGLRRRPRAEPVRLRALRAAARR